MALILLFKCTALANSTEAGERVSRQRSEALAGSSACHQLESREVLRSGAHRLHDISSSVVDMQHSASCSGAFHQDEQISCSQCTTIAQAGEGMCTNSSGEIGTSDAGGAPKMQGGQTSRSKCCVHEPARSWWPFKHREEHLALPVPELRRQVGIRWPQQDFHVTMHMDMGL